MSHKVFGDVSVFCQKDRGGNVEGIPARADVFDEQILRRILSFVPGSSELAPIFFATRNRTLSGKSWLASCFEENVSLEGGRHHHLYLLRCQPRTRRSKRVRR